MEKQFLKVPTPEVVDLLESCMQEGYAVMDKIMAEYETRKADSTNPTSAWTDWIKEWVLKCVERLDSVYASSHRSAAFRYAHTDRYATSGDKPYTGYMHVIESKLHVLQGYYDFILQKAPITINVKGSINYQMGNNNQNEQQ